ncbi:class I SAM-dependent methyltransferase [Williamsia herbipolensis]|uniref:Class I SAM-dependent methyltransferase n=1 Tax=Williamsia herbipolensis TaxID=1603258 RepID=A0AAU4K3C1_9NOCA|nr:class I SAM-dependent methyltransferase [Williamsia herbipolensis]
MAFGQRGVRSTRRFTPSGVGQGETFTVVDLFGDPAPSEDNDEENRQSYAGLTQEVFCENYRRVHDELPAIVRGPSTVMTDRLAHAACRFAHIDAGHLFEQVRADLLDTRTLLAAQGIVVADDWRTIHAPGVSAALWELVANHGLSPICVSSMKFYATWGDATPYLEALDRWLATTDPRAFDVRRDRVHGRPITMLTDGHITSRRDGPGTARWLWGEVKRRL